MRDLTKETFQAIKNNFRNILLFELIYRLVTGVLFFQMISRGLSFSLKMAGYSYLTEYNIGYFFLKPWTMATLLLIGLAGTLLLTLESGALITAVQAAAYSRKLNPVEILFGGVGKLTDEVKKKNVRLLILVLVNFTIMNLFLLYRILTHTKPLNFVMTGIVEEPVTRLLLILILVCFALLAAPALYLLHGCMIEQKRFRDGLRLSMDLLKGNWLKAVFLVVAYEVLVVLGFIAAYGLCVAAAALFVAVFMEKNLSMAVLLAARDKIELILIFIFSIFLAVVHFAAVTVQYYQFSSRKNNEPRWEFTLPVKRSVSSKVRVGIVTAVTAVSLIFIFDMVRNGFALADNVFAETLITAHRGSSRTAPENTMAALEAAVEEMADYAEIDVQETSDGVVVLFHDSSLKRITGVNRTVKSMTFEELSKLDAGVWFSQDYKGVKIPTLEEVMEFSKGKIKLNIEIKNTGKYSDMPKKVMDYITQFGMEEQCVVTSTNLTYLEKVKELNPDIHTGYIISAAYGDYYSNDSVDFISIRSSFINERLVADAHEMGKAVHGWTINSKSEMERMKLLGVDNIITDLPVLAREITYRTEATENLMEYIRLVFR